MMLVGVIALFLLVWLISHIPAWVLILLSVVILTGAIVFLVVMIRYGWTNQEIVVARGPQQPRWRAVQMPVVLAQSGYQQIQDERRHRERMASLKTLGDVLTLTPPEFEEFCGKLLELLGYTNIQVTGKPGDLGVDLRAKDPIGKSTIVQCKKYGPGRKISSVDIQKFLGMMVTYHRVEKGIYITTSDFSQNGRKIVKGLDRDVTLINGERLAQLIHQTASMWS